MKVCKICKTFYDGRRKSNVCKDCQPDEPIEIKYCYYCDKPVKQKFCNKTCDGKYRNFILKLKRQNLRGERESLKLSGEKINEGKTYKQYLAEKNITVNHKNWELTRKEKRQIDKFLASERKERESPKVLISQNWD